MIRLKTDKPYKIFAEVLDWNALEQFRSALEHPASVRGALMPDAHAGYTLPIGAVVATYGTIFPSWVGYDIGCTDAETEYLTRAGWKKISEYAGEEILLHDEYRDECFFGLPKAYIVNRCDSFFHLKNKGVDQMLTSDHRVLLYPTKNKVRGVTKTLEEWMAINHNLTKGVSQQFKTTIPIKTDCKSPLTDDEIRLLIAISADGCIRSVEYSRTEFHFKKVRKAKRLEMLADNLGLRLSRHMRGDGNFGYTLYFDKATKDLSWIWECSKEQLEVVVDEVGWWDGHVKPDGRVSYSSTCKENVDCIQYAFSACGIQANFVRKDFPDREWAPQYLLYTTRNPNVCFPSNRHISKAPSLDGKSYCFYTSTGYWVMRREGKIVITGNCGMCALPTTFRADEVRAKAREVFDGIYRVIPVGFSHNDRDTRWPEGRDIPRTEVMKAIFDKNGLRQLGSLGGGNHFIEIGEDEASKVWIIIHSGSRGIGHAAASHYMRLASGDGKAREGHFGFPVNSREGRDYRMDLAFCLAFALENRREMMRRIIGVMGELMAGDADWKSLINRNHNHAEEKDGLWIHRKGATHAEEGMMGVVPGNMRDGSFIVRGRGNPEALWSSSHGAGRVLGRSEAKRILDLEVFTKTMSGVVARVEESTLDESPFAYKNIFEVMRQQEELVDVVAHVLPIINVKG